MEYVLDDVTEAVRYAVLSGEFRSLLHHELQELGVVRTVIHELRQSLDREKLTAFVYERVTGDFWPPSDPYVRRGFEAVVKDLIDRVLPEEEGGDG